MPLINVRTSLPALKDGSALLQELSSELANQTGKPEAYVMTLLETGVPMTRVPFAIMERIAGQR